ncbi:hypothetical protein ANCCAN_03923 [Ancylostoma caninum]|uniref:Uncharacterized protein n=1 Tax=Ancylostoma caninum TaxID=29170 RepID=A0A368H299_ANCCA|nr:hypothetical protein ANCCAN_03923 [Ancylostoma caninum]
MSFDGFSAHSPSSSHVSSSFYDFSSLSEHSVDYRPSQISPSPQLIRVKTEKSSPPQAWAPPHYSPYEAPSLYSLSLTNSVSDDGNSFTYRQFKEESSYFAERAVFPTASGFQVHTTFPDHSVNHNGQYQLVLACSVVASNKQQTQTSASSSSRTVHKASGDVCGAIKRPGEVPSYFPSLSRVLLRNTAIPSHSKTPILIAVQAIWGRKSE